MSDTPRPLRYQHILQALQEQPIAITESKLLAIVEFVRFQAQGGKFTAEEVEERIGAARRPPVRSTGGTAVLPLHGVIAQRMNLMTAVSGGTSSEAFAQDFRAALDDDAVNSIVIDTHSPGGEVPGTAELADLIFESRGRKPITAIANPEMNSAAYWIASQADEVVATRGALVGSIGVVTVHMDASRKLDAEGIEPVIISAGKYKAEGAANQPLDADARAHRQEMVDEYYDAFVEAVARGRGVRAAEVRGGYGEGRVLTANQALAAGLVDRVGSFEDVLQRHTHGSVRRSGAKADASADDQITTVAESDVDRERVERVAEIALAGGPSHG